MENDPKYQQSIFEPLILKIEGAVDVMKALTQSERHFVLIRLLEDKIIDFPDLSKKYVDLLQKERENRDGEIATLSLWLGPFLRDNNPNNNHMRRFFWEKGYLKGSPFGDKLDEEFKVK